MADGLVDAVVAEATARVEGLTLDSVISGLQPMAATGAAPAPAANWVSAVPMEATTAIPTVSFQMPLAPTATGTTVVGGFVLKGVYGLMSASAAVAEAPAPTLSTETAPEVLPPTAAATSAMDADVYANQVVLGSEIMAATAAPVVSSQAGQADVLPAVITATAAMPTPTVSQSTVGLVTAVVATATGALPAPAAGQSITSATATATTAIEPPPIALGLEGGDIEVLVQPQAATTEFLAPTASGSAGLITATLATATAALIPPTLAAERNALVSALVATATAAARVPATTGGTTAGVLAAITAPVAPTIHAASTIYPSPLHAVSKILVPRLYPYSIDGHADDGNVRWVHLYQMALPDAVTLRWTDDLLPVYYGGNKFSAYVVSVEGLTTEHGLVASGTLTVGNADNLFGTYLFGTDITGSVVDIWQGWLDPDIPTQLCEAALKVFHGRLVGLSLSRTDAGSEAKLTLGPYADPQTKLFPTRTVAALLRH